SALVQRRQVMMQHARTRTRRDNDRVEVRGDAERFAPDLPGLLAEPAVEGGLPTAPPLDDLHGVPERLHHRPRIVPVGRTHRGHVTRDYETNGCHAYNLAVPIFIRNCS